MAKLIGLSYMKGRLLRFAQEYPRVVGQALYDELNEIEKPESQRRIPKDTHAAELSAVVLGPDIRPGRVVAALAYAAQGETNPKTGELVETYIVPLHENLDAIHPVGEAKFLESVMNESERFLGDRIARRAGVEKVIV
ncbi:MAG TPA: hypothetical protein VM531_11085 [Sphingomicrobium sp.]|jgi:hypothetical protein|nr:hypothetical protein [Sphingomicrobium sp.]